jgi:SPP1 gp7 family putative phage head morphogenesis protein
MPKYNLAQLAKQAGKRRNITLRRINPPAMLATDLYVSVHAPVTAIWLRGLARIMAEYERTLSVITTDTPADVHAEVDRVEGELSFLQILLNTRIADWVSKVEIWQRGKWTNAILSATSVNASTILGAADVRNTLENRIAANVDLIKDVSAQNKRRITQSVVTALTNRTPSRVLAKELRGIVDLGRKRSLRIAADQLVKISSELSQERRREAGIDTFKWLHSGKRNFRQDHLARDGKVYSEADPPPDRAGQLPNCGCQELGVLDLESF